jgi:bacterial/archaeal transporter family-2 protein
MNSTMLAGLLGLLAGAAVAVQAAVNSMLTRAVGSPMHSALVSFIVGGAVCLPLSLAAARPERSQLGAVPWWTWCGGALGACYVIVTIVLAPRIGTLALVAVTIAGQLLAAIVMEKFGLFSMPRIPLTSGRIVGAILLVAGTALVIRPPK